jgi:hypothetical protein
VCVCVGGGVGGGGGASGVSTGNRRESFLATSYWRY